MYDVPWDQAQETRENTILLQLPLEVNFFFFFFAGTSLIYGKNTVRWL